MNDDPRRNENTNQVVNQNDGALADHEDDEYLSLTLGSTSYSTQIPMATSSLMTTWPAPYDRIYISVSVIVMVASAVFSTLANLSPPVINSSVAPPPSNLTTPEMCPVTDSPRNTAVRRSRSRSAEIKPDTIPPPFPWATNKRGAIHSLEYLESNQITTITGEVQCIHCKKPYQESYNLRERFREVEGIFAKMKRIMRQRAPRMWTNPEERRCVDCGREKAVKPVIAERKSQINWLFLLLGQSLGYCTLRQLKNFCKHSKNHRTGARDRVLYLTYLGLCKMLDPTNDLFHL